MNKVVFEKLYTLAEKSAYPLYIVGGSVRDFLAKKEKESIDIDVSSPAPLEYILKIAEELGFTTNAIYKRTGTAKLCCEQGEIEYSTFRTDKYIDGIHTPVKIEFTTDILTDAKRRDFKCNAIYYDIKGEKFVDPLGALHDIKHKLISTTRDSDCVFAEDGLRLMRLARIAGQIGFTPTANCMQGAKKNANLIKDISAERVFDELNKILHADSVYLNGKGNEHYEALKILDNTRVLDKIIPELTKGRGMEQRKDFHDHDVLEHSLRVVKYSNPSVRFSALLHDVAKPYCKQTTGKFSQHEIVGEEIANKILNRLKAPKHLTQRVCKLISLHMYDLDLKTSENKVRKFIVDNFEYYDELIYLKQADFSGCKDDLSICPTIEKWTNIIQKMKSEKVPFTIKELKVNGNDIANLGCKKENIGLMLKKLLHLCVVDSTLNSKEVLLGIANNFLKQLNMERKYE